MEYKAEDLMVNYLAFCLQLRLEKTGNLQRSYLKIVATTFDMIDLPIIICPFEIFSLFHTFCL